jgi:hypothetical protein
LLLAIIFVLPGLDYNSSFTQTINLIPACEAISTPDIFTDLGCEDERLFDERLFKDERLDLNIIDKFLSLGDGTDRRNTFQRCRRP